MTADVVDIDGGPLTIRQVADVARRSAVVALNPAAVNKMQVSRDFVEKAVAEGAVIYGVTTGFGALAQVRVADADAAGMQLSLLRSHAAGVGEPLDDEIVRAMLLLKARTLSAGFSGVRPLIVQGLLGFLNKGLHPLVPRQGSVGASGDLAQLAHLALPLVGEGFARVDGEVLPGDLALKAIGAEPLTLKHKEGLALLNGTEGMIAVGCLALSDALNLTKTADIVCAMSVEALLGSDGPFDPRLHDIRPHPGQKDSAANLTALLAGSSIIASHRDSDHAVQDAYSVRCAPQVHGACRDVINFAQQVFERELASVTDNPVVLVDSQEIRSTGNFHGEPLGFALDFLAIALSELGSISERRTDRLLDPNHSSGLPPFLTKFAGTDSGFMLSQYTQAALVAENRINCVPATADTIPTSGSQEDHVSMGWNAALKLRRVVDNLRLILAVEALCSAQGIDFREPLKAAKATAAAHASVRAVVKHMDHDRVLGPEITLIAQDVIASGTLVGTVEEAIGALA